MTVLSSALPLGAPRPLQSLPGPGRRRRHPKAPRPKTIDQFEGPRVRCSPAAMRGRQGRSQSSETPSQIGAAWELWPETFSIVRRGKQESDLPLVIQRVRGRAQTTTQVSCLPGSGVSLGLTRLSLVSPQGDHFRPTFLLL